MDDYVISPYGVSFNGMSLFRASVDLPANIPIGRLTARIHLFHGGKLLDVHNSRVMLEREGAGLALHNFAQRYSFLYGLATVLIAVLAGLLATAIFNRSGH